MGLFRQRDPATGRIMFDTGAGDRAAIILGSLVIDYQSNPDGSVSVPEVIGATPFTFLRGTGFVGSPSLSIGNGVISWNRTRYSSGAYPTTGTWELIYGGLDLSNLGARSGTRMTLRSQTTGRIVFCSLLPMYQHNGRAGPPQAGFAYERARGWFLEGSSGGAAPGRMIAIRPRGSSVAVMGSYYRGNGAPPGLALASLYDWNGAGDFYVLERPTIVAARPGLNLRDPATNALTFSSAQQCLRAVDVIAGQAGSWVGVPGRVYAAVFSGTIGYNGDEQTDVTSVGGEIVIGDNPPYYAWAGYALAVSVRDDAPHILDFEWLQHSGSNVGVKKNEPIPTQTISGSVMIVDVTGV